MTALEENDALLDVSIGGLLKDRLNENSAE